MQFETRSFEDEKYLYVEVTEKVMTVILEKYILKSIQKACEKSDLEKVLLNISSIEKRAGETHHFIDVFTRYLHVHLAAVCRPELIDHQAGLFRAFTYDREYLLNYFTEEDTAINWLMSNQSGQSNYRPRNL